MNWRMPKITIVALLVIVLGFAGQRQAAAVTICTASISFPCTITSAGTYTLTGNLAVSSVSNQGSVCNSGGASGTGICLACVNDAACNTLNPLVSNVTIDLAGHTISASSGAFDAICGLGNAGVTIKNGTVDGGNVSSSSFSGFGVAATGANARAEGLQVRNSTSAIELGNAAIAADNLVTNNLIDNTSGITCGSDCVISHNVANTTNSNFTGTTGITTSSGGLIEENTVMGNARGLSLGTGAGYSENVMMNTTNVSGGTSMGKNVCNGNLC